MCFVCFHTSCFRMLYLLIVGWVSPPRQNSMAVQTHLHELLSDMEAVDEAGRLDVVFVDLNGNIAAVVAGV